MKLSHIFYAITTFLVFTALATNIAVARDFHNGIIIDNYQPLETEENKSVDNTQTDKGVAKSTAAGQHNFKATTDLQWSIGAGYSGNETALSFGIGLQAGSIFFSSNVTDTVFSGDSDPIIGIGASGTF